MSKLKVVHLITGLNVGGAEMMLYRLLVGMERCRYANVVVSLIDPGPMGKRIEDLDIPVYSLGMPRGRPDILGLIALSRLLSRERPHILQTWLYHAGLLGLISGKLAGVPHILWNVRSANPDLCRYPQLTAWTIKAGALLSFQPSGVIINSEFGRSLHASMGYRPRRWAVIPNGFDLERFVPDASAREVVRSELGLCSDTVLVGLIGRYHPMKDHQTFLQAAMLLLERHKNVHFLLAGRDISPANAELTQIIAEHRAERSVHLLGERADMPRLMASLDILTSSSTTEAFPNVVGEAMACEVPCVVTDVGDSAAIVDNTGLVVPAGQPEAMARAWQQLIDAGATRRNALGQLARERIRQNYSIERIVQTYAELYESLGRT
jgi:glycosyltransferase involved in cell wall biosynthesis